MNPSEPVVAFSTIDSEQEAKKIAKALVKGRLAACVNIIPKVTSIYEWKEEICEEGEFLLVIKTRTERLEELKATLGELHPYDVPELIVCPVIDGLPDYLNWVMENTK
ncbi:MAG: divalent-cation tolerance protein CutA [Deltaproteobacteria bacterium]|nr:divalent-cation tolerance protein CutA [Deltaproteobacteria bacterium]